MRTRPLEPRAPENEHTRIARTAFNELTGRTDLAIAVRYDVDDSMERSLEVLMTNMEMPPIQAVMRLDLIDHYKDVSGRLQRCIASLLQALEETEKEEHARQAV